MRPYSTGRKPWRSEPFQEETDDLQAARGKLFYFGLLVFFVFAVLTLQLARMQLVNGEAYRLRAENNRLRQVPVVPPRGLIYDRNGVPLVENRASFAAAVAAADVPEERQTDIAVALQEVTGVPAGEIEDTIEARRKSNDPFTPAVIKENLSEEGAFRLRGKLAGLPGSGYRLDDRIGKAGVELSYESLLRGAPGIREVETDASGREIRVLGEKAARSGSSVVLSIDLDLQRKVEEYLRAAMGRSRNAASIVVDVRTGEVP